MGRKKRSLKSNKEFETQAACMCEDIYIVVQIAALLEYLDHLYAHFVLVNQI